jgi:gluconolactonase
VTDELDEPNGLAFSPAEDFLYVDNWSPHRKVILRFPVRRDSTVGKSEVFACITSRGEEPTGGPYIYVRPIGSIGSMSSSPGRCLK